MSNILSMFDGEKSPVSLLAGTPKQMLRCQDANESQKALTFRDFAVRCQIIVVF